MKFSVWIPFGQRELAKATALANPLCSDARVTAPDPRTGWAIIAIYEGGKLTYEQQDAVIDELRAAGVRADRVADFPMAPPGQPIELTEDDYRVLREAAMVEMFAREIQLQTEIALLAVEDMYDAMKTFEAADTSRATFRDPVAHAQEKARQDFADLRFWSSVQAFLGAAANVSKALWGRKVIVDRSALRVAVGVDDTSPLKPRDMRNNFEHFDERLGTWFNRSDRRGTVDRVFGPIGRTVGGVAEDHMFRQFDPTTGLIVFWSDVYDMPAVISELNRIAPRVAACREGDRY